MYLINHVSTETLTSGWVILSGINSLAAEINCQSTHISYINIHLEAKCWFENWIFKNLCLPFIEVKLIIYYLLPLDYFEAIINIHKEHLHDIFILLFNKLLNWKSYLHLHCNHQHQVCTVRLHLQQWIDYKLRNVNLQKIFLCLF
jgi:hypothetical protein